MSSAVRIRRAEVADAAALAELAARVFTETFAAGGRTLWLSVWERNPRAIRFYEKHGFRDVGAEPFWVGSDCQTDRILAAEIRAQATAL